MKKSLPIAIAIIVAVLLATTVSAQTGLTVDGKERIATGNGLTKPFSRGDAVMGAYLVLDDKRFCSGDCFVTSAPDNGRVTSGVIHPYKKEAAGKPEATWQQPAAPQAQPQLPPAPAAGQPQQNCGPRPEDLVLGTKCLFAYTECAIDVAGKGQFVLRGAIWQRWKANGGLAEFGYPLSNEFDFPSTDGKSYRQQWFERAIFELHPENQPPFDVLLRHLGREFANSHDPNTVDGLKRVESPQMWFPVFKGQAAFGTKIMVQDKIVCDRVDCYVSSMPENGQVFNGVGHPWRDEVKGKTEWKP